MIQQSINLRSLDLDDTKLQISVILTYHSEFTRDVCVCCAAWLAVIYFNWLRGMNSNSSIEFQRIMALHFWDNLLRCSQNFCNLIFQNLCVKDWKRILKKLCCLVTKWHMAMAYSSRKVALQNVEFPNFLKRELVFRVCGVKKVQPKIEHVIRRHAFI